MVLAIKQPDLSVNKATADMQNKVLAKKKRYLWRVAMKTTIRSAAPKSLSTSDLGRQLDQLKTFLHRGRPFFARPPPPSLRACV